MKFQPRLEHGNRNLAVPELKINHQCHIDMTTCQLEYMDKNKEKRGGEKGKNQQQPEYKKSFISANALREK